MHFVLKRKHAILRSKGPELVEYFKKTYLNRDSRFSLLMWNHYDNYDERTNNRVEGDNNKMKLFCDAATRDTNFRQPRYFYREGIISLTDYLKEIINLYKFEPQ